MYLSLAGEVLNMKRPPGANKREKSRRHRSPIEREESWHQLLYATGGKKGAEWESEVKKQRSQSAKKPRSAPGVKPRQNARSLKKAYAAQG